MHSRFYSLLLLTFFLGAGCATQTLTVKDPVLFASFEDFKLGPKGGVDLVWSTKNISDAETLKVNLQKYDSLMLDQTWLVVDKNSAHRLADEHVLATSRRMISEIKVRLGHEYKLVERPAENTLLLSIALTNVETSLPILAVTSDLLPETAASSTLSKIVVNEPVRAAGFTVEMLVRDAKTREPLIAVIDANIGESQLAAVINVSESREEFISLCVDRLWMTLSYWNWIKNRTPES